MRLYTAIGLAVATVTLASSAGSALAQSRDGEQAPFAQAEQVNDTALNQTSQAVAGGTVTPIQHLVVIFDENISFDHYFGTYPYALNPEGEPTLPRRRTPRTSTD